MTEHEPETRTLSTFTVSGVHRSILALHVTLRRGFTVVNVDLPRDAEPPALDSEWVLVPKETE